MKTVDSLPQVSIIVEEARDQSEQGAAREGCVSTEAVLGSGGN